MVNPLVIAYHLVWAAYGHWLPNDPRGSGSTCVRSDILAELGDLHHGRKRGQPARYQVRLFYEKARDFLKHPLQSFDEAEQLLIAESFERVIDSKRFTCYACAIMPDHVHILVRKHKHAAEDIAQYFMAASREYLIEAGRRANTHPTWLAGNGWKVFLDNPDEIRRTIQYIENNPIKDGLPAQRWQFVKLYDGWPLHPGHSPNSPYAKRLRAIGRYP